MNWDDLRFLLAAAHTGSHSQAARALGVTQSTVGRRLRGLERALGVRVLETTGKGVALTAIGRVLYDKAQAMEELALSTERAAAIDSSGLSGRVCITASDWLVAQVVPDVIADVARKTPAIVVDCRIDPRLASLPRNEADLALRPRRFEANSVWQRAVGYAHFAMYASRSYLARYGDDLGADQRGRGQSLIMMDDDAGPVADVQWLAKVAPEARVSARVNGRQAMARLAKLGIGLACLPILVAQRQGGLIRCDQWGSAPGRTLWLGVHRDRRQLERVRRVSDALAAAVGAVLPRPRR